MVIKVSLEEYLAEKRHIDWLYYRIRLDIKRIKHWESIQKAEWRWANRLRKEHPDLYEKYAKPRMLEVGSKLRYWKEQREKHYKELKKEHERFRQKEITTFIDIIEVTAYLNYIPKSLGGKGRTNEYKVIRWVQKGTEDYFETEDATYELWSRIFYWFRPMLDKLKNLEIGSLQYGITNREDTIPIEDLNRVQDWVYALVIHPRTRKVRFSGTANITKLLRLSEEEIERGDGYALVSKRNNIFYHNCPEPYTGEKP